jgi:hypothetical protein
MRSERPQSKRPNPANDVGLDEALAGTFPASDPVAPPSHVEEEMARRRKVLEEDAANKEKDAADEALDEGLQETFPASDPVAVHRRELPNPDEPEEHKERRSVRRKRPAGKKLGRKKITKKSAKKTVAKKKSAHSTTNHKKNRSRR